MLKMLKFDVMMIDEEIAAYAAGIRAKLSSFKGMDALQLSAFAASGADVFLTNDKQLHQYNESKILLVDDLLL